MYQLVFRFKLNDLLLAACLTVPVNRSAVAQWFNTWRQRKDYYDTDLESVTAK